MRLESASLIRRRVVEHRDVPIRNAVLGDRRLTLAEPVKREKRVPQDLKHPRSEVGSRLEAVREAEGPQVRFLNEVVRFRRVAGQIHGEVVERVEVLERLPLEVVVGHASVLEPARGMAAGTDGVLVGEIRQQLAHGRIERRMLEVGRDVGQRP